MKKRVSHFKFFSAAQDHLVKGANALRNNNNINAKLHIQNAIKYFKQIDVAKERDLSRLSFAYYLLGITCEKFGNLKSALECYQLAIVNMYRINSITNIHKQIIETYQWHLNDVKVRLNSLECDTSITKLNSTIYEKSTQQLLSNIK